MKVVFRADASLQIGTGHVMRCLTLADKLESQGVECQFICREHVGNLIKHIQHNGYVVHALAIDSAPAEVSLLTISMETDEHALTHSHWLGATWEQDAAQCALIISELEVGWLIVDHYALDARWEAALKPHYQRLMVIDDLADRPHDCDLLLDQTFGRNANDYKPWVPADCSLLCGSQYALLRPEFAALRAYSLQRRESSNFEHLLITMGGVDKGNATGQVLQALELSELPANCNITVVMGSTAPWLAEVRQQATQLPWSTTVRVGVNDMAQLMAESDLAVGAAGASSWERCCLGLPTIMFVLAENQKVVAHGLEQAGAAIAFLYAEQIPVEFPNLLNRVSSSPSLRGRMSHAASRVADGSGAAVVVHHLGVLT